MKQIITPFLILLSATPFPQSKKVFSIGLSGPERAKSRSVPDKVRNIKKDTLIIPGKLKTYEIDPTTKQSPLLKIITTKIDTLVERDIKGIIKDKTGAPISGIMIMEQGKPNGTTTNQQGEFNIKITNSAPLTLSWLGITGTEVNPAIRSVYNTNAFSVEMHITNTTNNSSIKESVQSLKQFPLPYPRPSAVLPLKPAEFSSLNYFYQIDSVLSHALTSCRYDAKQYYYIDGGGFALVTQMEQIDKKGKSLSPPARWQATINGDLNNVLDYIKALFSAPSGNYRVLVFIISNQDISGQKESISQKDAEAWLANGYNSLPLSLKKNPLSDSTTCTLLIYHYTKMPGIAGSEIFPDNITGQMHYDNSQLASFIEK
jgi:hypothetical protein